MAKALTAQEAVITAYSFVTKEYVANMNSGNPSTQALVDDLARHGDTNQFRVREWTNSVTGDRIADIVGLNGALRDVTLATCWNDSGFYWES